MDTAATTAHPPPQNGNISNMDSSADACATNTDVVTKNDSAGATKKFGYAAESNSNGFAADVNVNDACSGLDSNRPGIEDYIDDNNAMTNGLGKEIADNASLLESQAERVPQIFVCTEHCKTECNSEDEVETAVVPQECASSSTSTSTQKESDNAARDSSSTETNNAHGDKNEIHESKISQNSQSVMNTAEQPKENGNECNSKSEGPEDETNKIRKDNVMENDEQHHVSCSDKENGLQSDHTETSGNHEEIPPSHAAPSQPTSSSPSSSTPASSSPPLSSSSSSCSASSSSQQSSSSRFSFFRSIQNILIASKWSKLRAHGSPKSQKQQNTGSENDEEQHQQQRLKKPETRQRKISAKSQPGELLRKQSQEEKSSDQENDSAAKGREGLEYLDSPSSSPRNSKDKGSSPAKGNPFSLFKRHSHNNTSSDSQQQQQQQQQESPPQPPTPPPAELTERQKVLLRSSWAEIGDSVGQVGVIAFIGLFETHPDVIDHFDQFRGMSLESVFTSISLKEHALRVMTTVEKFLNRIDRPDKLKKILEDLGKRHVGYKFKYEYIKIVGMQFIGAMKPHVSSWTSETEQAWTVLIDTMTFHMQTGAFMEMQQSSSC